MQVDELTSGDFDAVKVKAPKFKFQLNKESHIVNRVKVPKNVTETGHPLQGLQQKQLMRKCFNKHNRAIASLIHTSEKIKHRSVMTATQLDRMLDRVDLDRSLLINEKLKSICAEPHSTKSSANQRPTPQFESASKKPGSALENPKTRRQNKCLSMGKVLE